jgi:hypothetical protein
MTDARRAEIQKMLLVLVAIAIVFLMMTAATMVKAPLLLRMHAAILASPLTMIIVLALTDLQRVDTIWSRPRERISTPSTRTSRHDLSSSAAAESHTMTNALAIVLVAIFALLFVASPSIESMLQTPDATPSSMLLPPAKQLRPKQTPWMFPPPRTHNNDHVFRLVIVQDITSPHLIRTGVRFHLEAHPCKCGQAHFLQEFAF